VILDIDAGNTRIKWRIVDGGEVIVRGDQSTVSIRQEMPLKIPAVDRIARARLSCVAGNEVVKNLQCQLKDQFDIQVELAEVTETAASVVCGYRDYKQLGVDRWLALATAYGQHTDAVIVVDVGSAITVDIVDAAGLHRGGYIVPGFQLMRKALWQGTEHIKVEPKHDVNAVSPGLSTADAVDKGCLLSIVSMVESLTAKYEARLVVTGGDAMILQNALSVNAELYADLVLDGLALDGICLRALN